MAKKAKEITDTKFLKDDNGAIQIGKAVLKPDKFFGMTEEVYKMGVLQSLSRAMYSSFEFDSDMVDGKPVVKLELAIMTNKDYEKLNRKVKRLEKQLKGKKDA